MTASKVIPALSEHSAKGHVSDLIKIYWLYC